MFYVTVWVKLPTSPTPPPPSTLKKGQDCVVEGTSGMSVQLYVLTKKQTERKPDPLLSPPNIFFRFLAG